MTEQRTSSQIQAHLEHMIAHHPGCRGFKIEVKVRRLDEGPHDWDADFYATGAFAGGPACKEALIEILASARADYTLGLDS